LDKELAMPENVPIEQAERLILDQVKFIDFVLKEIRKRNKDLEDGLGMSYAKLVGLVAPFEEAIHSFRQVKKELDGYLKTLREKMVTQYKSRLNKPTRRPQS